MKNNIKKILFVCGIFILPEILYAQKIEGVVTYFFNDNIGDKPDIGAMVYVVPDSIEGMQVVEIKIEDSYFIIPDTNRLSIQRINLKTLDSFANVKLWWYWYDYYSRLKKLSSYKRMSNQAKMDFDENMKKQSEKCKEFGINSSADFSNLDKRAQLQLILIERLKLTKKTVVDGAGKYSVDVPNGGYYVLIVSEGRSSKGNSVAEASGKIFCKNVKISSNEIQNISPKFGIN